MRNLILSCALAMAAAAAVAADPPYDATTAIAQRRDLIAYHIEKGSTPQATCAAVIAAFGGKCSSDGRRFVVSDERFYAELIFGGGT